MQLLRPFFFIFFGFIIVGFSAHAGDEQSKSWWSLIGWGEVKKSIKQEDLVSSSAPQLKSMPLSSVDSIGAETSAHSTSKVDQYIDLEQNALDRLFTKLSLKRALKIATKSDDLSDGYQVIEVASKQCIRWEGNPDWTTPDSVLKVNKLLSASKTQHELRKLGITNVKFIAGLLGIGGEAQYKSSVEQSEQSKESYTYLLMTYDVPKIKLSISMGAVQLEDNFLSNVRDLVGNNILLRDLVTVERVENFPESLEKGIVYYSNGKYRVKYNDSPFQDGDINLENPNDDNVKYLVHQDIRKKEEKGRKNQYRRLIEILEEYGFFVSTEFVLGGQIYAEDIKKETTSNKDASAENSFAGDFALSIQSPFSATVESGMGKTSLKSTSAASLQASQNIFKQVRGGDAASVNDTAKWTSSLGSYDSWSVIKYGELIPIIAFLDYRLRAQCLNLIGTEKNKFKLSNYAIDMGKYISHVDALDNDGRLSKE